MDKEQNVSQLFNQMKLLDDEKAFEKLFHAFYNPLTRFAQLYLKSEFLAEEVVSDVLYAIWHKREELEIGNIRSYLFRATKNRCLNELQRNHQDHLYLDSSASEDILPVGNGTPLLDMEEAELFDLLEDAVAQLPAQCKVIFNLVRNEQMSHKEVAEILNISSNTVNAQLFIAVKKITSYIENRGEVKLKSSRLISSTLLCFLNFL
jgi:RNA polymerase sigma-70 factor, Bacteroides expansion family 1